MSEAIRYEDDRTTTEVEGLRRAFLDNLVSLQGKSMPMATPRDHFFALAYTVRDRLFSRWIKTMETQYGVDAKRVYYLSAEFLIGRLLSNCLLNLGIYDRVREALAGLGIRIEDVLEEEVDAGLGNGGLGRLAACFLDSMATIGLATFGYGIRYEFGIFHQVIRNGQQVERPDEWLRAGNPWEIARPEFAFEVKLGGHTVLVPDGHGGFRVRWVPAQTVLGVPYDTPIIGFGNDAVATMRLWRARASEEFDLEVFNAGDYVRAVEVKNLSENISKVLYPQDHSPQGKELRLKQQYFFTACSVQDIVRRYMLSHRNFDDFAAKVAIQMNDTHPSIAIAELMRVLVDEHGVPWDQAWEQTRGACAYTNHTILAEALEKWPTSLFQQLIPRHLEIVFEINSRFLREVRNRHPTDTERAARMSIIDEGPPKQVRMAHLAFVGSHAVNGVAELHTRILRERVFAEFHEMYPDRLQNKTNGVTPRRWLLQANPRLSALLSESIGTGWTTDLDQLKRLEPFADDAGFREQARQIKQRNKVDLARVIRRETGIVVDPAALFSVQVKRIHEYKRQLLNILHVMALYRRIKRGDDRAPRVCLFGGKAAPGYVMAKNLVRLINAVADVVNRDADVGDRLKVVFLPNYRVSQAEVIMPACDLSEQISTAGYEASGTGCMKASLNGALTIGTLDGANIEIREAVGAENFFLFGMTAEEVAAKRAAHFRGSDAVGDNSELRLVIDLLATHFFTPEEPGLFRQVLDSILGEDRYFVCADFADYARCQADVDIAHRDPERWTRMAVLNIARMGRFSSDRTIREYARDIWKAEAIKVTMKPYERS
ncbi:MAG TPA: glycogen/starch/alpha-glucan phosphorylase [Haliangiales bacterium]|nr:glycogen/starch/alpha-glucan phosphorylase [Haliangiales bacterium]